MGTPLTHHQHCRNLAHSSFILSFFCFVHSAESQEFFVPNEAATSYIFLIVAVFPAKVVRCVATDLFYPHVASLNMKISWSSVAMADVHETMKWHIKNVR